MKNARPEIEGNYINKGFMNGRATWYNEKQETSIWYEQGRWRIGRNNDLCSTSSGIWTKDSNLDPWNACPHWPNLNWRYFNNNGYSYNANSNDFEISCAEE